MADDHKSTKSTVIDLPTVSYRDLMLGSQDAAVGLLKAASIDGFFQLDLRDTPAQQTVLDALPVVYKAGKQYFAQSPAVKEQDRRQANNGTDRGFTSCPSDEDLELSIDEYRAGNPPFPAVLQAKRETIGNFMESLDQACRVMLASLSASLGLQEGESLDQYHHKADTSESGLKFVSEPTLARIADVADNTHTDGGTFTIIFCKRLGLQTYLPRTKEWAFVPPKDGCCVVNVADALSRFSHGVLHSPRHRVTQVEDGAGERLYLSHFLRPSHKYAGP
ncbi:unnamed protein product [Zymoseptoria tritici ST99CH_3D1]|uniref:Isopenicillin N synthase-like Fe(2+) 2OG dioxygenase domain-containing protein n=2 Tax=Zymoseptoria tritici TaxID=1047171 RepID=F9XIH2_ZYMTI|nr:uncharacterized protein MYCGRDRAFT_94988 [Zymoseptoria tritici IPO323]EGP84914.1 hypothetical protein MYCGRDRAFT_94988 [Zymoseptoria tritici IPO323]SMQ53147.1 unnamed protein product [Zymoseptoria tritici ST99CH_3D7]SMR59584.1 unnamed protein product [Zymoseptoria tritici ST99CH_3D1]